MTLRRLAHQIKRILIDTFTVTDWQIETDTGWQNVSSVSKTAPYDVWRLKTASGKFLECADDHIVFDADGNECFVKTLIPNVSTIRTIDGVEIIVSVERIKNAEHMYDLEVDSSDHRFYSNDILSHNSITTCAYILHIILFKTEQNIAILANKYKISQKLLADLKKAYISIPLWMQSGVKEWNKGNIELENGCKIMASSTSSDAIRGNAFNLIFLDEFAFVPDHIAEEFFDSVYPTISSGETSKIIIVSTPKGMNKFHKMWVEANNPKDSDDITIQWNGYVPFEIHWSQVPGRDKAWEKATIARTSQSAFDQEYGCEFLGSTNTLISANCLKAMVFRSPIRQYSMRYSQFPDGTEHRLDVHKEPIANHQYILCADVAGGKELDSSAFVVIDITEMPYYVVAKYKSDKITTMLYPDVIEQAAIKYNNAFVLVETNDNDVAKTLQMDLEYENLVTTITKAKGVQVGGGFAKNTEFGLRGNRQTKRTGCLNLKTMVEAKKLIVEDYQIIAEFTSFVQTTKGSYAAEVGQHDDLVMCLVNFGWLINQQYFKDQTDTDVYSQLKKDYDDAMLEDIVPFGFCSSVDYDDDDGCKL